MTPILSTNRAYGFLHKNAAIFENRGDLLVEVSRSEDKPFCENMFIIDKTNSIAHSIIPCSHELLEQTWKKSDYRFSFIRPLA